MTLHERLMAGFRDSFGEEPQFVGRAPGRINIIGEHTDYNDGFAMPVAIGQETRIAFTPGGSELEIVALDIDRNDNTDRFDPSAPANAPHGDWRNYVRGVADELTKAGHHVPGGRIAVAGNVERGTGLSSSASLEVALGGTLLAAGGQQMDAVSLAILAQRAECDFVGMRCGNLDQIAASATQAGHSLLIDCRSLALQQISFPAGVAVMIVQSGVVRGLVDGHYNRRREQCEQAATDLGVAALRDADEAMLEAARSRMDPLVYRRARHIITDNRRVLDAAEGLAAGDLAAMGTLMRESHASLAEDFEITVPHTDRLAALMNDAIGPLGGARQTGGGFGGAVIALMPPDRIPAVTQAVATHYRAPDGSPATTSIEYPSQGFSMVDLGCATGTSDMKTAG